ncbi:nitrogenase component 1 [Sporomusa acidovorans]|uniref:Light-independent protochlorophyllide reductase subunit B n=1 Tax=Sporomusa acidovorans (strain ATCC 49682 / DSM 3132 / Mol) TaxID=1123286 RepID=A0ABZ3IZB9_SPOA4|nr:nitrogenase component 1 [Sporomusa acidovorans]OZC17637.1 nitrogenase molybdenum-iron protein alpha chain [Sporomusa acidovorans DSM 3132]SDE10265.1 nitrogenase molybdenum-cofactor synthesis protein NifE [Sporomusa acidovorans]
MCNEEWNDARFLAEACALTGSAAFFAGIPDAVLIANGPMWCYYYALRYLQKQCPEINARFYCTQADNHAVIYGTEECLLETLQIIRRQTRPAVVLIENSCSVSLIGDDIAGIARQADLPCPVVCMDSGGMEGGFAAGYRNAAKAYFDQIALTRPQNVQANAVNLLGGTVGYYRGASDVRELERMLKRAGYQVLACPGAGSSTGEITAMAQAALNIVVHDELGLDLANMLQERYGMPYVTLALPYGLQGSFAWLETIRQHLTPTDCDFSEVSQEVKRLERKQQAAELEMQRIWGDLWFAKTLIAAPASVAVAMAVAVRTEWLDTGRLTVVSYDRRPAHIATEGYIDAFLDAAGDSQLIEQELTALTGGLLLGSSNERAILQQRSVADAVYLNIALPVYDEVQLCDWPLMGFRGACYLTESLWNRHIANCQRR